MKTQLLVLAAAVVILVGLMTPTAQAQVCNGNGGCGWGLGYGWLYNSLDYNVPYFAAHPPVYYSYPVPRTYGYSPFAYPPYVMTPDVVEAAMPLEIVNPYVPKADSKISAESGDRSASAALPRPLVVVNPYYSPSDAVAQAGQ